MTPLVVAVMLLPMWVYADYLAFAAFKEGARFRAAPLMPSAGLMAGSLYRVEGVPTSNLLSPVLYPEIKDALSFRVSREVKDKESWSRVAVLAEERLQELTIGGAVVRLSPASRVMLPHLRTYREGVVGERLVLESIPLAGEPLVVLGFYESGKLADGSLDRLLVTSPPKAKEVLDMIDRTGKIKALLLAGIGALGLGLNIFFGFVAARRAKRR